MPKTFCPQFLFFWLKIWKNQTEKLSQKNCPKNDPMDKQSDFLTTFLIFFLPEGQRLFNESPRKNQKTPQKTSFTHVSVDLSNVIFTSLPKQFRHLLSAQNMKNLKVERFLIFFTQSVLLDTFKSCFDHPAS